MPLVALLSLITTPAAARQQWRTRTDPAFVRIESLIAADRLSEAREALAGWQAAHPAGETGVTGADRAAAGLLQGRLARNWAEAEKEYLGVALSYPATVQATEALLRLGQGLVTAATTGNARDAAPRAVAFLERLVADYPNARLRPQGVLWLARALRLDGRPDLACRRIRQAAQMEADSLTRSLIAADIRDHCAEPVTPLVPDGHRP